MMSAAGLGMHVAGVGASAGGLEAMLPMFAGMQATGRIAYIVAQHMARDGHDALVVRLIGRESSLPVVLAKSQEKLRADTVYVLPSGMDGTVEGDRIVLREPGATNISTPSVNTLFESIAASRKANGIGIVLSGTGYDGVAGCRALKAQGALTIAQEPAEAKFDGMPTAAIEAGLIDEVITVDAMGTRLAERFSGPTAVPVAKRAGVAVPPAPALCVPPGTFPESASPAPSGEFNQLLEQVHQATGIDFGGYKEDTLLRRIDKRMATLGLDSLADYLALARKQPEELKTLQRLFLVSVSSFFRDADAFRALKMSLARLLEGKPAGEPVRVWVAGCASGEEAYTLAILLKELTRRHPIEIVATDLNPDALALADAAMYRQNALKETESAVLARYFEPRGDYFAIKPEIRACVIFEQRDVFSGSPPDRLDLVSCRNLLIYLKSHLQDQLIRKFDRALRPQGLLFIGPSESLSLLGSTLFMPIDHYHRLFRQRH